MNAAVTALALAAFLGLAAAPARAQLFQVKAEGVVTELDNRAHVIDPSITVGTPFTCTETFDFGASDTTSNEPSPGQYTLYHALYGATITIGRDTFAPSDSSVNTIRIERLQAKTGHDSLTLGTTELDTYADHTGEPIHPYRTNITANLYLYFRPPSPPTSAVSLRPKTP